MAMNITTSATMIQTLKNHYDNGKLSFDPPMQRRTGQWLLVSKSLWIHSILSNYPLPSIFVWEHEGIKYVIDGVQRLHTLFTFIEDDYSIHRDTPDVVLEDETYIIAKRHFSELDEDLKYDICRSKLNVVCISDCDYEVAAEIFYRLNSSTPLSINQRGRARYKRELVEKFDSLMKRDFISEHLQLTKSQYLKEADLTVLIQAIMLIAHSKKIFTLRNFSSSACNKFINEGISDELLDDVEKAVSYLDVVFRGTNHKIKKMTVPMIICLGYKAYIHDIAAEMFSDWYDYFLNDEDIQKKYMEFCGQSATSGEKIFGRCNVVEISFSIYLKSLNLIDGHEVLNQIMVKHSNNDDAKEVSPVDEINQ